MLFGKRERAIQRILIVEDEALVAFDSEHLLGEEGYDIVGTVDSHAAALAIIEAEELDLVMSDISLSSDGDGFDVARAAAAKGIAVLFVSGSSPAVEAQGLALGCLAKPYTDRSLKAALEALDRKLQGLEVKKLPPGLSLYEQGADTAP